jgi:hypothetical protein
MNKFLLTGALCSGIAALLHIGCIIFGAPWYRFFGAGEQMARLAEQGSYRPAFITSIIVAVLASWSMYALSGAGVISKMPLLNLGLWLISAIYLLRGIGGFFLMSNPMGRSPEFWLYSSAICLAIGLIHLVGVMQLNWRHI